MVTAEAGMVQTESEGRRGPLPELAIEGSTRVEEAETEMDAAREMVGFIWAVSSCSGWGLVEGGAGSAGIARIGGANGV
jgi:hypothetical protein